MKWLVCPSTHGQRWLVGSNGISCQQQALLESNGIQPDDLRRGEQSRAVKLAVPEAPKVVLHDGRLVQVDGVVEPLGIADRTLEQAGALSYCLE